MNDQKMEITNLPKKQIQIRSGAHPFQSLLYSGTDFLSTWKTDWEFGIWQGNIANNSQDKNKNFYKIEGWRLNKHTY